MSKWMMVALVAMTASCATSGVGVARPVPAGPTIEVANDSWSDIVVYVVDAGGPRRLGMVSSNSSTKLALPIGTALIGPLQLLARPIAGKAYALPSVMVSSGQRVAVRLMNELPLSHVSVRDR